MALEGIGAVLNQAGAIQQQQLQNGGFGANMKAVREDVANRLSKAYDASEISGANSAVVPFGPTSGTTQAPSFGEVIGKMVGVVDAKDKAYNNQLNAVLTGESDNIHAAILAQKEARTYFKLATEIRNKLVESFQEIMRMNVG